MAESTIATDTGNSTAEFFDFQLYRYTPSLSAAAISVAVFGILTGLHTWRLVKSHAWYFAAFTIGGLCESTFLSPFHIDADNFHGKFKPSVTQAASPPTTTKTHYPDSSRKPSSSSSPPRCTPRRFT